MKTGKIISVTTDGKGFVICRHVTRKPAKAVYRITTVPLSNILFDTVPIRYYF